MDMDDEASLGTRFLRAPDQATGGTASNAPDETFDDSTWSLRRVS